MEGSPEGRYLPEPFFTIHLIVAAFMVALQCLNTAYAVHICRRQRSSFTTVLAIQQALLVVFCICKLARSWAGPLGDNESQTARILYLVGDTFYTLSAFLYLLLLIRRFSLGNSAGLWYRPSWDPIMITAAIVLFCFAFISGVYRGIQRLDTTAFPGYEKGIRYNIVCYCVFTLFILAMDTVLSFLMYKRICILKSQLDAIGLTTETPSHRRTIYGMIGLVGMSWIAVTAFVVTSFAPNMDRVVRAVLAVIAMSMSIVHMSFALLYLESIRRLMTSFDFAQALAPEGDLNISGKA